MLSATQPDPRLEVPDTPYEYKRTSASVGSPSASCHMATGSWLVKMVERNPERSSMTSKVSAAWSGAERPQQEVIDDQDLDRAPRRPARRAKRPSDVGDGELVEHAGAAQV